MKTKVLIMVAVLLMLSAPVMAQEPCYGDFDCDGDVMHGDIPLFKQNMGRWAGYNPCPPCYDSPCPCSTCPYGMVDCGNKCVDPKTDREYCGANVGCFGGTVCGDGEICVNGTCRVSCPPNLRSCSGVCVDTSTDENYCGSCTMSCVTGEMCIDGVCSIPSETCEGTLSPLGRWCDQGNGTVKDMTTGLMWLKDVGWGGAKQWANCTSWDDAHTRAGTLYDGMPGEPSGLSDGSVEGDWRLPTKTELVGITTGTESISITEWYFFTNVQSFYYWSSTTDAGDPSIAWYVWLYNGNLYNAGKMDYYVDVWPVRNGQ